MVPTIGDDEQLLSQFTVSVLKDFGYQVDFNAAEYLTTDDVKHFSDECTCDAPLSTPGRFGKKKISSASTAPEISVAARAKAEASGRAFLARQRADYEAKGGDKFMRGQDVVFIGDKVVVVTIKEGDNLFDVIVFGD